MNHSCIHCNNNKEFFENLNSFCEKYYDKYSAEAMKENSEKNIDNKNIEPTELQAVLNIIQESSDKGYTDVYVSIGENTSVLTVRQIMVALDTLGYSVYLLSYSKALYISWAEPKCQD